MWLTLMAGTFGGVPAALLAAWVAVSVLRRSNRKQQELVELQVDEQRREASVAREKAATADLISATMNFITSLGVEGARSHRTDAFGVATFRWQLEVEGRELTAALLPWGILLSRAATGVEDAKPKNMEQREYGEILTKGTQVVFSFCTAWHRTPEERSQQLENLSTSRRALESRLSSVGSNNDETVSP